MCNDSPQNSQEDELISAESEITDELGASNVISGLEIQAGVAGADLGFQGDHNLERRSDFPERLAENDQSAASNPTEMEQRRKRDPESGFLDEDLAAGFNFLEEPTENGLSSVFDSTDAEEREGSSSKRQRLSIEERRKQKSSHGDNPGDDHSDEDGDGDDGHNVDEASDLLIGLSLLVGAFSEVEKEEKKQKSLESPITEAEKQRQFIRGLAKKYVVDLHDDLRQHKDDSSYANRFTWERQKKKPKKETHELQSTEGVFHDATEEVKKRQTRNQEILIPDLSNTECNILRRSAPSLVDLASNVMGRNSETVVSLLTIPEDLRNKIADAASDSGKVDVQFVELLTREHPTELRLKNCSQLKEEDLTRTLSACDNRKLNVIHLELCGRGITKYMFRDTFGQISHGFPALTSISLRGAFRLTDSGLALLCRSAPALQSIDLSQCSLLSSYAIHILKTNYAKTLKKLYLEDCKNMLSLPSSALSKFSQLEVLSVAGIECITDYLVTKFVRARGAELKELFLANCSDLTTESIRSIGSYCPQLHALDLSHLTNLTDEALQYLANGCPSIYRLEFCRNDFSDTAVAAFLEVTGGSLYELSLNNIRTVAVNTIMSLAKSCSRHLHCLDLSWCRKLRDSDLSFLLQACPSIRRLTLFGITQISEHFIREHSKSHVQIIGLKATPTLDHLGDI